MDNYQETFETWNKIASLYEDRFMHLDLYNATYDFICGSIEREKAKILEIGCGPGNITKYLLTARPDFEIFGIDVAPNMITLARKNNPSAQFAVMDCRQIGTNGKKFDGIVCGFCLPYLSPADSQQFIGDCYNLLEENGLLYISFVEGDPARSGFQVTSSGDRSYFYYYNLTELETILTKTGFSALYVWKLEYQRPEAETEIHTILTVRKNTSF